MTTQHIPSEEELKQEIIKNAPNQTMECAVAMALANKLGATCHEIGRLADELNIKIVGCQLGCF